MTEIDINKMGLGQEQQKQMQTKVIMNHLEASYVEDANIKSLKKPERIYFVENFASKKTSKINNDLITEVNRQIEYWKEKMPETDIVPVFQFKKGETKTAHQLEIIRQAHSSANTCLFYEQNKEQSVQKYEEQLDSYDFNKKKKMVVLEIESSDILPKISVALNRKIRDFIIIGGLYNRKDLWVAIEGKIYKMGGTMTFLSINRMNNYTKQAYVDFAITIGADYFVHGKGRGGEVIEIRYLDSDLFFRTFDELTNEQLKEEVLQYKGNNAYYFSRLLAVRDSNNFAKTHKAKVFIQE